MVIEDDIAIGEMVGSPVIEKLANIYGLVKLEVEAVDTASNNINNFSYEETMSIIASGVDTIPVMVEVIDATGIVEAGQTPAKIEKGDLVSYLADDSTIPRHWRVKALFNCKYRPGNVPMAYLGKGTFSFPVDLSRITLVEKGNIELVKPRTKKRYNYRRRAA